MTLRQASRRDCGWGAIHNRLSNLNAKAIEMFHTVHQVSQVARTNSLRLIWPEKLVILTPAGVIARKIRRAINKFIAFSMKRKSVNNLG